MIATNVTVYGLGGYDPNAADGNIVEESVEEREETDDERADREFREAVDNATSVADLKAALLGTNITGRAESRPQS